MSINFLLEVCRQFSKNLPPLKALHNFLQHHVKSIMIIIYYGHMDETENTSRSERFLSPTKALIQSSHKLHKCIVFWWGHTQYIDQTVIPQLLFSFGTFKYRIVASTNTSRLVTCLGQQHPLLLHKTRIVTPPKT